MSGDAQHACPADHEQEPGQGHQRVRADADSRPHAHFAFATDRSVGMLQYYEPTTAGHREATVFGSSMVIDVVIADP
jgi:hypothetical protein